MVRGRLKESAGRLAWGDGGGRLCEGADVVAAVVGVQGYPDTAGAGAGADVVLARERGLHPVGRGSGVPERDDVPACGTFTWHPVRRPSQRRGLLGQLRRQPAERAR